MHYESHNVPSDNVTGGSPVDVECNGGPQFKRPFYCPDSDRPTTMVPTATAEETESSSMFPNPKIPSHSSSLNFNNSSGTQTPSTITNQTPGTTGTHTPTGQQMPSNPAASAMGATVGICSCVCCMLWY